MARMMVERNGRSYAYEIDGDTIRLFNPDDAADIREFGLAPDDGTGSRWFPGTADYNNCVRGCYPLQHGSPAEFAGCLALCCFG